MYVTGVGPVLNAIALMRLVNFVRFSLTRVKTPLLRSTLNASITDRNGLTVDDFVKTKLPDGSATSSQRNGNLIDPVMGTPMGAIAPVVGLIVNAQTPIEETPPAGSAANRYRNLPRGSAVRTAP
jgi:hypothetical protein